jgi:oligopeptidase B
MEHRIYIQSYGDATSSIVSHCIAFPHSALHTGTIHTPRGSTQAFASFQAGLGCNPFFATDVLRCDYSSATHPGICYEYNLKTRTHRVLKEETVPNYDASLYRSERIVTPGRRVPVSLVYRKDLHPSGLKGGPFPVLLTGYGAYGASQDLGFDGNRLSLLDRGVVYALAHVRGGGDLGRDWYESGRYLHVKNRFADFVDAAETLISLQITTTEKLAAWGTSSGGMLVTASMNLRPDLFRAVLLEVPFVDAVTTMSDPSIPLTVGEWEEIGNPNEREYFYYMLEYSPYDNIRMDAYPAALITCSLHDSMVGYWEPLKYASKLRLMKTDDRPVLLKVSFNAGHGGTSDRYESMEDYASHFAFLLDQLGIASARRL